MLPRAPMLKSRSLRSVDRSRVAGARQWLLAGSSGLAIGVMLMAHGAQARSINGGSASFVSAPTVASDAATQAAQQAVLAARKTQDSLARAAKAVQDMQAAQAAARAAAAVRQISLTAPMNVPNGLGAGGLLPNVPAGWTGANAPTQSVDSSGQTQVGIRQTTSSAILNWTSFNIGARTTLTFDQQGNASWVALNRIDSTMGPSQILGNIKADGQVYVVNQSGIIFGGASQVNVGSLIASTAGITDAQFTANGIYSSQNGASYIPSFTAAGGKVVVEAGAAINTNAPASVTAGGGFVLLLGSQVENAGSIGTPKGQTILAAGDDFIICPGFGTQVNTSSTTRGSEIAPVIAAGSSSGGVSNSGLILAQQGDITLAGRSIEQSGALIATTSVNTRGTIHLLNSASDSAGSITLDANSLTSILPELDSTETALDSQRDALIAASVVANLARAGSATGAFDNLSLLADRQDQSRVEIVSGGTVTFKGGSYTSAQGGQIAVSATQRIVTETGSTLDASGVRDVALAMASNNISVNVQGNELRDSPQNRDSGVLLSNDVWIDVRSLTLVPAGTGGYASDRYYTGGGLLEVGGYLGTTAHTIGEWTAVGGSITLSAPQVIAQAGSTFDISGGSLDYAAGWIRSTNLVGSDGRIYSVDNAPADMQFVSFAGGFSRTHNIQGQQDDRLTEIWTTIFDRGRTSLRWEDAYTVGRDAGQLILSTPTSVFEGTILADTIDGQSQGTKRAAGVTDGYKVTQTTVAQNGTLALGQYDGRGLVGGADSDVVFGKIPDITTGADPETASYTDRKNTAFFDVNRINAAGLGGIDIVSSRSITIDAPLQTADGAVVTFKAPNITLNSDLVAHSGTVTLGNIMSAVLTAGQPLQYWALTDADGKAQVTIGVGASVDLTGTWSDLAVTGQAGQASVNGGSLTIATTGGITLADGSLVDVSSGASRSVIGKVTGGKGGDVSLITNDYDNVGDANFFTALRSAKLILDGNIAGYGFTGGGTLTLNAGQKIVIGGGAGVGDLQIDPGLFTSGFGAYDITGIGGVAIADGTQINPVVPVYRMADAQNAEIWLPQPLIADAFGQTLTRRAGVDITLAATNGDFTLGQGASITVDPGHAVNIYAYGQTTIDGSITAKGGNILVAGAQLDQLSWRVLGGNGQFSLTRSIWIGEDATLDVSGYASTVTNSRGQISGSVADGGTIALGGADNSASDAFVIIRPGAVLDASGTSAAIDIINGSTATRTLVASDGGTIALNSNSGIYNDGTLRAAAGGAGASGGMLILNLVGRSYSPAVYGPNFIDGIGDIPDAMRRTHDITITQQREASGLSGSVQPGQGNAGLLYGNAAISAEQIAQGGFGSLALHTADLFAFKGDVNLSLTRNLSLSGGILTVSDATPNINVALNASYVAIDGFTENLVAPALYNLGINSNLGPSLKLNSSVFSVSADLLDVSGQVRFGVFGLQGSGGIRYVSDSDFTAVPHASTVTATSGVGIVDAAGFAQVNFTSRGDIRFGDGTVKAPGDVNLTAAQIYPLSNVSSVLYAGLYQPVNSQGGVGSTEQIDPAHPKSITIRRVGNVLPQQPASVFGSLSLVAATIDQGGVVRAPLGLVSFNSVYPSGFIGMPATSSVIFRAGSITSASANGLVMPLGDTSDGVSYQGGGTLIDLGSALIINGSWRVVTGIAVAATSVIGEPGSLLDVSGGGTLTGAGFLTGRGGSVDVLNTALVNANPAYANVSAKNNQVYAIMPGYASAYAPAIASNGAGDPAIGQQITVPAGVPGLPAGTYTLLPSSYALLPGAFRVEIGSATNRAIATIAMANGSYNATATLGFANATQDALPTQVIVTAGQTVRTYSQYNETSFADFARSQAAQFGNVRPRLPVDGGILEFLVGASDGVTPSIRFAGTANFAPVDDGYAGSLLITSSAPSNILDITAPGVAPIAGHSSLSSADINAFQAASLFIGGAYAYWQNTGSGTGPRITLGSATPSGAPTVNLLDGADLRAGQVFLIGTSINVAGGATIDTRGQSHQGLDSSLGYVFGNVSDESTTMDGPAILAVANGWLNFLPVIGTGKMTIASGASLLSEGSIVLGAPGALSIGDVNFGARYLTVTQNEINIGDAGALAAAQAASVLPAGWTLDQVTLDRLLHPSTTSGVPALERITLTAGGAINIFGSATLDARSQSASDVELVLNTPAIYGLGSAADTTTITADHLIWNGIRTGSLNGSGQSTYASKAPDPIKPNGAGTGSGNLVLQAQDITFGYDDSSRPTDGVTLDRIAVGFGSLSLVASNRITGNSDGTLSLGQSKDGSGNLNLTAPLITAEQGASIAYNAGGAITATGAAPAAAITDLGGTLSFSGSSVLIDTTVALPSGKLSLTAVNDVTLGTNTRIDLAGRTLTFYDETQYSWGGDLVMSATHGDITQQVGAVIDVSAQNNNAGLISATAIDAAHGQVTFGGTLRGTATDGYLGGRLALSAQDLGDFAALNTQLNQAGFFGARSFALKQGDLTVGSEVIAHAVSISVDAGSLTIAGKIDASGTTPGTISLSAQGNIELTATGQLDAHGEVLQMDSNGQAIEANNRATVELTTTQGTLLLDDRSLIIDPDKAMGIDVRVTDLNNKDPKTGQPVAYGQIILNAPRLGSTGTSDTQVPNGPTAPANAKGNDIAISAGRSLNIEGAASIALNGFATYTNAPADPNDANGQIVDQAWLDLVDKDSSDFIKNAYNNDVAAGVLTAALQNKLAGLTSYGSAFHLRPGVSIASATPTGNLSTKGDLDLSKYRYGADADRDPNSPTYGAGEVGVISFRAGGNLNINGSINDGFAPPPASPDALAVLFNGTLTTAYTVTTAGQTLSAGAVIVSGQIANFDIPATGLKLFGLTSAKPAPTRLTLAAALAIPAGRIVTGTVYAADGTTVIYANGATTTAVTLPIGTVIAGGTFFSGASVITGTNAVLGLAVQPMTIPAGTSLLGFGLAVTSGGATLSQDIALSVGAIIPVNTKTAKITGPGDRQIWAIAPMLAPGSQSWSIELVGGADLAAADSRALLATAALASGSGNVVLNDPFSINIAGKGVTSAGVSVVRTGTGDLSILAGGNYQQSSPFGVYTAGSAIDLGSDAAAYNVGGGLMPDGTVLGTANAAYEAVLNAQRMYYATGGGDLLLVAQGDIGGYQKANDALLIGNWLWRQGGNGQATAWGINFGSYVASIASSTVGPTIELDAFSGVGTLGGGKVTLTAGRDIGDTGQGIVVAVAGSGRVLPDGTLTQTGGGTLSVTAGRNIGTGGNQFTNLRGNTQVSAGSFGALLSNKLGVNGDPSKNPLPAQALQSYGMLSQPGGSFAIGDGTISVQARGDLAMGTITDPGRVGLGEQTESGSNGSAQVGGTQQASWFTLWTPATALDLMAAGGDLAPLSQAQGQTSTEFLPSILRGVAASGSIYLTPANTSGVSMMMPSTTGALDLLAQGSIIESAGLNNSAIGALSTSLGSLATPFRPAYAVRTLARNGTGTAYFWTIDASNVYADPNNLPDNPITNGAAYTYDNSGFNAATGHAGTGGILFAFGANTVSDNSSAEGGLTSHIYAVNGDITGLGYGMELYKSMTVGTATVDVVTYRAAKPVAMMAGGNIVNLTGVILQDDPNTVSTIAAGGDVIYAGVNKFGGTTNNVLIPGLQIAGPGTLEVTAGKNIYQGSLASIDSIGPLVAGDSRPGASVVLQAGVGSGAVGVGQVDWAGFAALYLDPANLADAGPLADQPGKVAKTYDGELYTWLKNRYGYTGTQADALAYFGTRPAAEQRIFLRQVYYAELTAGGREYTDTSSSRYHSYLRGKEAIAALFPADHYAGDITMFSAASGTPGTTTYKVISGSVHTDFGGDIQFLAPGGKVTIGTEGLAPGADAGLITQGDGDIQLYSDGSVLLGLSRVMTTFGGDIVMWSAEGDINAGRGSKTTVLYTPPKRTYDIYGNVKLAPQVPSSGAGIATLNPIPAVPPGDIDLIAPEGTIDAGEAGIRHSGNVNLAALQVVNAANITGQGSVTGVPTVQAPSITAALSTSNATAATQQAATPNQGSGNERPSVIIVEVLGYGGGNGADEPKDGDERRSRGARSQNYDPSGSVRFVGMGELTDDQKEKLTAEERDKLVAR